MLKTKKITNEIQKVLDANKSIRLDIGCGERKMPGFVGMDYRKLTGVDIVQDVTMFPWPIPDESVSVAVASHLVEHINPMTPDPRIKKLLDLLVDKKILSSKDIHTYLGDLEPGPIFMRFMDEVWRVLQYDGEFGMVFPYAGSPGFYQDPTHINNINENTWEYFDPLGKSQGMLYGIYRPKPWKIKSCHYAKGGNMEVVLIKRRMDKSYGSETDRPADDQGSESKQDQEKK